MPEVVFNKMIAQVDTLSYFQRIALLKKLVSSFDTPQKTTKAAKAKFCNDAFGIWKDSDISIEKIRSKAWR